MEKSGGVGIGAGIAPAGVGAAVGIGVGAGVGASVGIGVGAAVAPPMSGVGVGAPTARPSTQPKRAKSKKTLPSICTGPAVNASDAFTKSTSGGRPCVMLIAMPASIVASLPSSNCPADTIFICLLLVFEETKKRKTIR